ncbi:hypothetical protein HPE56_13620 [Maribacter sp. ANRC-HE7]|uniref:Uncharacterized protein n=1 Tax=Maribacter aquimaris TaxID=2737171 RepID=A0ABR7V311_9FLAO|nr:hypothetical protein [Maribacter aquimaris]MBD0778837.1 hypothetical protein [Maribacter aquimaris]
MKRFIRNILVFILPVIILTLLVIWLDFFKVFGFQDYYATQTIGLNREMITTKTFNHYREEENFDSFIFGSSRSQAYKCENWAPYLPENSKPFHFDASGEGIWGISKKIEYIDELGDTIKNALVLIDRDVLRITDIRDGHLFISMPCVSKQSEVDYYGAFLKASLNPKFLISYLDYTIFKTHRGYMGPLINPNKFGHTVNDKNGDIWYGVNKEIKEDSLGYYNKQLNKGVFYERPVAEPIKCAVTEKEITQLNSIKAIFNKHNTNYKIVIGPTYDQVPMEEEQLKLLQQIFGKENIYDFSGKNVFSEPISNFYESVHYKPHVANKIMELVYKSN